MTRPEGAVKVGVAVPAAGSGTRMGGARKPFLELLGETVLARALAPFLAEPRVCAVVVALSPDDFRDAPGWITDLDSRVQVVLGGASRTESVRNALLALPEGLDIIAVHDAARPLVTAATVTACIDMAATGVGAVAGCPAVDTLKRVTPEGRVLDTPDRSSMWHAHTPQVFPAGLIRRAYGEGSEGTDDASLVERIGGVIQMVDGGTGNIKVTRPTDVAIAEAILKAQSI
jgi:2-C-methyl-D-erythritol 4-phosphate cytidylyltransferase